MISGKVMYKLFHNKFHIYFFSLLIFSSSILANDLPVASGFIPVEGGKLYYQQFGKNGAQKIFVLHGGPGLDSSYLLPQMSQLANETNQVTFYDQRGSGKSLNFSLDDKSINMQNFVKDLDTMRMALGNEKIIIIGHSWGALLGMCYTIAHPNNVAALILVSGAPASSDGFKVFGDEYIERTKPLQSKLDIIEKTPTYLSGNPTIVEEYFRTIFSVYFYHPDEVSQLTLKFTKKSALSGRKVGEIFGGTYLNNYNLTKELQDLKIPVLIIHGKNDIVPISTAITTYKNIPGSKMITIDECNHFPYIERQDVFFKYLQEFIAQNVR